MPPISSFSLILVVVLLLHLNFSITDGFGSMGPISAAHGEYNDAFFCAIDASGQQGVVCWAKDGSSESAGNFFVVPPVAALSGGEGFMCGVLANTSQAFCWDSTGSGINLVPSALRPNSYFHIASGKNHVCAIRGSYYNHGDDDGNSNPGGSVDCWDVVRRPNSSSADAELIASEQRSLFSDDENLKGLGFKNLVSGDGFSCGSLMDDDGGGGGGVFCWGPNSSVLGISSTGMISENFSSLASGRMSLCGISEGSREIKCWGNVATFNDLPSGGVRFVSASAGNHYFCGIREDTHGVECWGIFNSSAVPKNSGFFALASADNVTCGIREEDLVIYCWFANQSSSVPAFNPPLQLCSPGLCSPGPCGAGEFAFNPSVLAEPDLTSLCVRKELTICSPCASNCSAGFFLSSPCTANSDRVCTSCSLCQNSSCWGVCGLESLEMQRRHQRLVRKLVLIIVPSAASFLLIVTGWCFFPYLFFFRSKEGPKQQFKSLIGKQDLESDIKADGASTSPSSLVVAQPPGEAQIFRLSELKDATNGFKEFNELGRGSYGFVYKAVLTDGSQVAVKRANAATIIHTNIRDFEMELEVLCKLRHSNIVNLLGYCTEMGERLLVYEYMPHGPVHDHLHAGLSPLNWNPRLRIAAQAAKGLEYLHKEAVVHRDIKTSNILLDSDWGARIADFGCLNLNEKDLSEDMLKGGDVYNFGIVLLEILSGRKAYDVDYTPPSIVEWAVPFIRQGKGAAIIDRYIALPKNVEPLLKLAELAESALKENSKERPSMSDLALSLEQIWKDVILS